MFDIVIELLKTFIDMLPNLIGLDLVFGFVGALLFSSGVK